MLIANRVNSQATILDEDGPIGRPDRIIRSYAFMLTALVGNTQQDRPGTVE